jgi:hypothetical protein
VFIGIFLLYLLFIITFGGTPTPVASLCSVGLCPSNFYTGIKDCSRREYDVSQEVCASPGFCEASIAPCAKQPDGSSLCPGTVGGGVCASGQECGCVMFRYCPEFIRSYFVPYTFSPTPGVTYNYFGQHSANVTITNQYSWDPPLNSGYPNQDRACTLDVSSLRNVANKQCLAGTLTKFAPGGAGATYGCAAVAETCPTNQHPVWDYTQNKAVCQSVSDWPSFWLGS